MKLAIAILTIFFLGCSNTGDHFAKVERKCKFSSDQKESAWSNVITYVRSEYPDHAKYCELNESSESQEFLVVEGECRIYLGCSNQIEGEVLLHGDMLVVVDEKTQKAIKVYGVKW